MTVTDTYDSHNCQYDTDSLEPLLSVVYDSMTLTTVKVSWRHWPQSTARSVIYVSVFN